MLKNLSIRYKIYLLAFTTQLLMLIMGSIAVVQMAKIGIELVDIAEIDIPLANKITEQQLDQNTLFERALFNAALHNLNLAGSLEHLNHIKSELAISTKTLLQDIEVFVAQATNIIHTEEGKEKFRHVSAVLTDVEHHYIEVSDNSKRILDVASTTAPDLLATEAAKVEELQDALKHELIDLLNEIQKFTLAASLQAEHDEQS
jgi:methyl-accepting chemotaxis protein